MPLSTARLRRALADLGPTSRVACIPLDDFRMLVLGTEIPPAESPIPTGDVALWQPVAVGAHWGAPDVTAWFHASARVPEGWRELLGSGKRPEAGEGRYAVTLRLLLGLGSEVDGFGWPEGLLYVNGRLAQGINRHHEDVLLRPDDAAAETLTFDVRAWSGRVPMDHRIEEASLALLDRDAEALAYLLAQGADLVDALGQGDPLSSALLAALEEAADALDPAQAETPEYRRAVAEALAHLRARLAELRAQYALRERPRITAVGHGHLDVAWLWQLRHTHEKTARTFGIATALMERYPEYVFMHTTPQVFAWLKDDYPALYERVMARAREGRFEVSGAMWLESDTNLVSGEALVRQIAHGQRFMRETLGHGCELLWLPDVFGYTAALPQIMLRSGLSTFVTTKMSWSATDRLPMDTFRWRGIDGSEVLAHFITTPNESTNPMWMKMDTYNGRLNVRAVLGAWERYRQKAINDELVLAYGFGDGGAGPTREMLEQARAIQQLPGAPDLRLGRADEVMERIHERVWEHPDLPTWDGELYLEYHRGTYTTQAWLKRAHRQAEANLLLAELLDAWAAARGETGPTAAESRSALDDAWRTLLLHEFHDILPGSSIHEVYRDAREAFARLHVTLHRLIEQGLSSLAASAAVPADALLVFNPTPWPQTALVALPASARSGAWAPLEGESQGETSGTNGTSLPSLATQNIEHGGRGRTLVEVPDVPPLGYRVIVPSGEGSASSSSATASSASASATPAFKDHSAVGSSVPARAEGRVLENGFFRVELDESGAVASLVDKRVPGGRELFRAGQPGNELLLFDDRPEQFDAWDIDASYEARTFPLGPAELSVVARGPLRATIRVVRRFGESTLTQDVSVYQSLPRIDFATQIDWHERHRLLKAAFPLDLRTTHATYEIQYGAVDRATHRNTSWDAARFEVSAHRWVDLSEGDYGVSLLNDGRYGHDVHDSTLRISLVRGPTYPDPQADQGEHVFTYSLYPHVGDWRRGGTVPAAYALNRPARVHGGRAGLLNVESAERNVESAERNAGDAERARGGAQRVTHRSGSTAARATSLFSAEPEAVVIEAVKRPDEGDGLIVRVYETYGGRHTARVRSLLPIASVEECDLLERPLTPGESPAYEAWRASPVASHDAPTWDDHSWSFQLRPYEVRTFRLRLA